MAGRPIKSVPPTISLFLITHNLSQGVKKKCLCQRLGISPYQLNKILAGSLSVPNNLPTDPQ